MDPHAALWEHCLEVAALSDVGLRRANNQDSLAVATAGSQEQWQQRGHLFVVADGMGAHAAGELASKLATDTVPLAYQKLLDRPPHEALRDAIRDANTQIYTRGSASDDFRGMGTTVSTLVLAPQGALVAQVGDSRVYRLRGHRFEQLTFDHSLVWELRAAGQIPAGETPNYIPKNIITRSLGPNPEVQVDLEGPFPVQPGDTFLLCSDGLSGQVRDDEIGKILAVLPPKEAVRALVDMANLRGGPDNITVIVVRVTGPQATEGGDGPRGSPPAPSARPVHPAIWAVLGIAAAAALVLAAVGLVLPALLALVVAAGAGMAALIQRHGPAETAEGGPLLGRAPYGRWDATPDLAFVTELSKISQQLRDAAAASEWAIDWQTYNARDAAAVAATRESRFADAAREHSHAIAFLMEQLRHQGGRKRPSNGSSPGV